MNRNIKPTQGKCQHLRNPDGKCWCGYAGPTRWWSSPAPLPICVACHFAAMRWTADARDAAEAALERVRALHQEVVHETFWDTDCYCRECSNDWPCPTIQAMDGK